MVNANLTPFERAHDVNHQYHKKHQCDECVEYNEDENEKE